MTSILTNTGAMVALQTLKQTNKNMTQIQSEISTGKRIANSKDNAAIFAIATVMESDVAGFKAIQDSLSLGQSSVAVARNSTDQISGLIEEIKSKVTAAQEDNIDRTKVQNEINELRNQIDTIVGAAQFNGLNLLNGSEDIKVLSSLDRAADGTVSSSHITVTKQNLSQDASTYGAGGNLTAGAVSVSATPVTVGATETLTFAAGNIVEGDSFRVTLGGDNYEYIARRGDTLNDVAARLKNQLDAAGLDIAVGAPAVTDPAATNVVISITNNTSADLALAQDTQSGGVAGGVLEELGSIDVSTSKGAIAALVHVENIVQQTVNASAKFGAVESRLEIQNDFISNLVDNLKSGIGSLVDANMEEASARLQALQVQQQLGTQALSIANQTPQSVLSLFQ